MKIALAQLNIDVGNFEQNTQKAITAIKKAEAEGADLVVSSEQSVCGYPSRDFLDFSHYISLCDDAVNEIAAHTQNIAAGVGSPCVNPKVEGKDLFNSAYFMYEGKVQYITHKTLLPTYDVFDEYRYFEMNTVFEIIYFKGKKLAITICEDIWNIGNHNPLYPVCPMDELIALSPDVIINLSASLFSYKQREERFPHLPKINRLLLVLFKKSTFSMRLTAKPVLGIIITAILIVLGFIYLLKGCLAKYDERFTKPPVLLFEKNGKSVVFAITEFQKTVSYTRKGGMVRKSVNTTYYIQTNDASTAEMVAEKKIKKQREIKNHPVEIMGASGDNAWLFMNEPMAFDAFTLELKADKTALEEKNPSLAGKLPEERRYYFFNPADKNIYFTPKDGTKWKLNTQTL